MRAPRPAERVGMILVGMAIGRGLVAFAQRWDTWRHEAQAINRVRAIRDGARLHRRGPTVGPVRITIGPADTTLTAAEIENHLRWLRATNGKLGLN